MEKDTEYKKRFSKNIMILSRILSRLFVVHRFIDTLRLEIQSLPPLVLMNNYMSDAIRKWIEFRRSLRQDILTKDPRYFLRWPVIQYTMFYSGHKSEIETLRQSSSWKRLREGITENTSGHPVHYKLFPKSSGNLIHQAYTLHQLENAYGVRIETLHSIFEFGGGYGSAAQFVFQMGFNGTYTILDLPEFSLLQRYFFSTTQNITMNDVGTRESSFDVRLRTDFNMLDEKCSAPDLFLAAWSLSESPIDTREKIFEHISQPRYYLIAYQDTFQDIDNVSYFETLTKQKLKNYTWKSIPITHLPGNTYLIGKRNE